jgi:hypothetical protein
MVRTTKIVLVVAFCVFAGLKTNADKAARAADQALLTLKTFAVGTGGPGRARAGSVDFVIERWSTESERQGLRDALIERGSDRLLSALHEMKPRAGYIRGDGGRGWDIQYGREETRASTGSRRIVFATDRPMSMWELINRPRSSAYEFTFGEIRIGVDGKGEGKLATAAKVSFNKDNQVVEIENYSNEPVRLIAVIAEDNDQEV